MLLEKEEIGLVFHFEIEWHYATILPIANFTKLPDYLGPELDWFTAALNKWNI